MRRFTVIKVGFNFIILVLGNLERLVLAIYGIERSCMYTEKV
jgi:hypothetical protein